MIINIKTRTDDKSFSVTLRSTFTSTQSQSVEYVKTLNGTTHAFNRGSTFDKYISSFTIQGLEADIFDLSKWLVSSVDQITITTENEMVFGAGIDYSNDIICNVLNSGKITYSSTNNILAEIPLKIEALSSNNTQLQFIDNISETLPTLNYQTSLYRSMNRHVIPWSSSEFGSYGQNIEVDQSGNPINSFEFSMIVIQNQEETAQIEKFYSNQRSTPFIWSGLTCLDLFDGQDSVEVMIIELSTTRNVHNSWTTTIKMVTNV